MSEPTVAIVGLGLMGGSLARDLAAHGIRVLGHDRDPRTLHDALASRIVAEALGDAGPGNVHREDLAGIEQADWLVLAVPVDAAEELLEQVLPHSAQLQLITDLGSTKRDIAAVAQRLRISHRFVGSHPLAGDHRSGWHSSRAGLFAGRRVFLCAGADAEPGALRAARALWRICGARTEPLSAAAHDQLLAWTSHLPQVLATTLGCTLDDAGIPPSALGAGGRDMTRLAASSPEMWTGIAMQNADMLYDALTQAQATIDTLRRLLSARDRCGLHAFFSRAAAWAAENETATPPFV